MNRARRNRGSNRRRVRRTAAPQKIVTSGVNTIKSSGGRLSVSCNGVEVPATRSFHAISLRVNVVSDGPSLIQVELMSHNDVVAFRSPPFLVGVTPVIRNYRWPARVDATWVSTSANTLFSVFSPCNSQNKPIKNAVIINYSVTLHMTSDYESNACTTSGVVTDNSPMRPRVPHCLKERISS